MVSIKEVDGKKEVFYTLEEKEKALSFFVTSTRDNIYACNHNVPEEIFGAFGSFFSRNPKDLREHLFDAIIGKIPRFELEPEEAAENLESLVNGHFESPAEALRAGVAKSQKFFKTWYGTYSHKSIANTVWIKIGAVNISQLMARQLAYDQLNFFIEQSTRFVKFDTKVYYKDQDIMQSNLSSVYTNAIEHLCDSYSRLLELGKKFYTNEIPFDKWYEMQNDKIKSKKDDETTKRKYQREINAKVFDDVRFVLPQATLTNIAFILDARSLEYDIASWKGHPLREIRESSELLEKHAGMIAPSLLKYTEKNYFYSRQYNEHNEIFSLHGMPEYEPKPTTKHVNIISYDPNLLDNLIALELKRNNQGLFDQFLESAKKRSLENKIMALEIMVEHRKAFDEWLGVEETFDIPKIIVEFVSDIGAIRDLRRHQKNDRDESRYTLDMGYTIPPAIEAGKDGYGEEALEIFKDAMHKSHEVEKQIRRTFPFQAQYVIPMACNHSLIMSLGIDQLQYMIYTRSTPEGNWSYRQDMFNLAEQVLKIYPWLVGYKEYPHVKNIKEVYEEAPFTRKMMKAQADFGRRKSYALASGTNFNEKKPAPTPLILRTEDTGIHK